MTEQETLKICFVGGEQSGKTALIIRILFDEFESNYGATLEDSYRHAFVVGYKEHQVDFLDIGGVDIYKSMYQRWFSWAEAFVFVFSLAEKAEETFYRLKAFRDEIQRIKKEAGISLNKIPMVLVGTHLDVERQITEPMGKKMADAIGCPYFETSSKANTNKLRGQSHSLITPQEVITHLIQEKTRKATWHMLDELSLPPKKEPEKKEKPKPKPLSTTPSTTSASPASVSLMSELVAKWSKPIDKLPVYIDLPRLASKISVVIATAEEMRRLAPSVSSSSITIPIPSPTLSNKASSPTLSRSTEVKKDKKKDDKKDKKTKKDKKEEKKDKKSNKKLAPDPPEVLEAAKRLTVGMRVRIPEHAEWGPGTLQFNGTVKFEPGLWVGIALDAPRGKHNGMVKGVTYFQCLDNCGVFCKPNFVEPLFTPNAPDKFSGGTIKSTLGEEWHYSSSGIVVSKEIVEGKQVRYEWDGCIFKPANESPSFGAGQWNGEYAVWYKKEWMVFRTSKREEFLRLTWNQDEKKYEPENQPEATGWIWLDDSLTSMTADKASWTCESVGTKVPRELIIFLQMIRYSRYGFSNATRPLESNNNNNYQSQSQWQVTVQVAENVHKTKINPQWKCKEILQKILSEFPQKQGASYSLYLKPGNKLMDEDTSLAEQMKIEQCSKSILEVRANPLIEKVTEKIKGRNDESARIFKFNVQLSNWKLRIPFPDNGTIQELMAEITQRAKKKLLSKIETRSQETRTNLINQLDLLSNAVNQANYELAAQTARSVVDAIDLRIANGELIAPLTKREDDILELCDQLEQQKKVLVSATRSALKNQQDNSLRVVLTQEIAKTKLISVNIDTKAEDIVINRLITTDGADLFPEDTIKDVLNDESTIVAILGLADKSDDKISIEAKKKLEAEARRKAEQERQQKEEEEQQSKWNSLFEFLQDEQKAQIERAASQAHFNTPSNSSAASEAPRKESEPMPTEKKFIGDVMRDVLCELAEKLGELEQMELIKKEFFTFVKQGGGGDTSRQLAKFLQHVLNDKSKLARVLKAINQSIIATPFIRLKMAFPSNIPFEDRSGTWRIIVKILPNEEVEVVHKKSGTSKDSPPTGGYEFNWELVMRFNWEVSMMLSAHLIITSVTYDKGMLEANKKLVQRVIDSFKSN